MEEAKEFLVKVDGKVIGKIKGPIHVETVTKQLTDISRQYEGTLNITPKEIMKLTRFTIRYQIRKTMTIFWFVSICIFALALGIGCVGIFETLVMGDPDEWISIGQFVDILIGLVISIFTYKALK